MSDTPRGQARRPATRRTTPVTRTPVRETSHEIERVETLPESTEIFRTEISPRGVRIDPDPSVRAETPEETIARLTTRINYLEAQAAIDSGSGRRASRMSTYSEAGDYPRQKPKLEKPDSFDGDYTPTQNVLNWIARVEQYFEVCEVAEPLYTSYARTYLSTVVGAWVDATYGGKSLPEWSIFKEDIKTRFLPADHEDRLEQKFETIQQRSTLTDYVESFQRLDAAMIFAQLEVREARKIRQFIKGLNQMEDRRYLLQQKCTTMQEIYKEVTVLRQAKLMAKSRTGHEGGDRQSRKLKKLTGQAKQQAWEKGLCLGCGSKEHYIAKCPHNEQIKKTLRELKRFQKDSKKKPSRKYKKLSKEGSDADSEGEEEEDDSDSEKEEKEEEESPEDSGSSGNDDPESQG